MTSFYIAKYTDFRYGNSINQKAKEIKKDSAKTF